MICYRLSSAKYSSSSGKGAALTGGRWNPIGVEVIYSAASPSLAVLEILVHYSVLPRDFVLTPIKIPRGVPIEEFSTDRLPHGWNSPSSVKATREIGRRWAGERRSAVLSVPSSIVPIDRNFLINPFHPDFQRIAFLPSEPFYFDQRLK